MRRAVSIFVIVTLAACSRSTAANAKPQAAATRRSGLTASDSAAAPAAAAASRRLSSRSRRSFPRSSLASTARRSTRPISKNAVQAA